ncbi:hypothetical protein BD560DRAFT_411937 [Blakeslea trispora]|nr:hypothetical protein BD560DRAFT_411937 [Blakeslea trispora]
MSSYCELCNHRFIFTPIYRHDMPARIPLRILLRQSIYYTFSATLFCIRFGLAVLIWLFLIPVLTTWTWRFYFWTGSHSLQGNKEIKKGLLDYGWSEALADCLQGLSITATVVVLFVAAYLFRDWVIRNTASIQSEQQMLQPERDRGRQLATRLEALRQELEQRRNEMEIEEVSGYNNPYATSVSPYEAQNRLLSNLIDEGDIPLNPPSGTQSPFASWRDYQQGNSNSSLNDHTIDHANQKGLSRSTSMLRLQEPIDYFGSSSVTPIQPVSLNQELTASQPNHQPQELDTGNPNADDQEPFNFSENMDSFLEAIGMRGNILTLIKNAVLMTLMINLCLWIIIWIPYVIGSSIISIDFVNLMDISANTIYSMLDSIISLFLDKAIIPLYTQTGITVSLALPSSIALALRSAQNNLVASLHFTFESIHILLMSDCSLLGRCFALLSSDIKPLVNASNWELIRSSVHSILIAIFRRWKQCATGQSYLDRSICTLTGYTVLISIGSWYVARTRRSDEPTSQAFRQQWVFLKVLFFISLELVVLPTLYGILLDISTLPLFTDQSIKTRFHFVLLNPYSGILIHWFIGTGLVLQFSIFIELIREVVRPGVLYFLPDPKDLRYRPIQDIAEQPVLLLIKKMCRVAFVYFMLILVGMGIVTIIVSKYSGIYPIIWTFSNPIMPIPIDLLIIQFLLPPAMKYLVPREFSKKSVTTWWHIVSRHLRLSSYMFGGRYPREEGTFVSRSRYGWLRYRFYRLYNQDIAFQKDNGRLMRVPSHDHVPLVLLSRRMIVPVDEVTLEPLDPTERRLMHPAVTKFGSVEADTTVVYIPSRFKLRISMFVFLIWVTGSILMCSITVVPLLLGRLLFSKLQSEQTIVIHDLYSFTLGACVMISLYFLLNSIVQKYQSIRQNRMIVNWRSLGTKAREIVVFTYMAFMFGLLIPLMLGIVLDLYLFSSLRYYNEGEYAVELYLVADWALGLAGMNMFHGIICTSSSRFSPTLRERFIQLNLSNFTNLNIGHVSKNVIAPLAMCLFLIILLPSITCAVVIYTFAIYDPVLKLLIFRYAHIFYLCGACCSAVAYGCLVLSRYIVHRMRNDVYLVGQKLHNMEE